MQQYVDGDTLFAHILMLRTVDPRTVMVVEGSRDCQALDPHIEPSSCQTLPAFSRRAVERLVELVDQNATERVLGIADLDFSDILGGVYTSQNLIRTDDYDLDATILFAGDVAVRVIAVFSDRASVEAHVAATSCSSPIEIAVRIAAGIGALRFLSERDARGYYTRTLPIEGIVNQDLDDVDQSRLAVVVAAKTASNPSATDIEQLMKAELPLPHDPHRLCSGHDLATALAWLIRKKWGGGAVGGENVAATIRAALSCETLKSTNLYAAVKAWATAQATVVWSCG